MTQDLGKKTLCSLIWKPITAVFIKENHSIDFHREICTKNNAYKQKNSLLLLNFKLKF